MANSVFRHNAILVFSDGSKTETGTGSAILSDDLKFFAECIPQFFRRKKELVNNLFVH